MTLNDLVRLLEQHGVTLTLTPDGKLKPAAAAPPPPQVIEGIRQHREILVRRLERGQQVNGRFDVSSLDQSPRCCASCTRWKPTPFPLEGECGAGRQAHGWQDSDPKAPVLTHPAHQCAALGGFGYRARADRPSWAQHSAPASDWDALPSLGAP